MLRFERRVVRVNLARVPPAPVAIIAHSGVAVLFVPAEAMPFCGEVLSQWTDGTLTIRTQGHKENNCIKKDHSFRNCPGGVLTVGVWEALCCLKRSSQEYALWTSCMFYEQCYCILLGRSHTSLYLFGSRKSQCCAEKLVWIVRKTKSLWRMLFAHWIWRPLRASSTLSNSTFSKLVFSLNLHVTVC